ncbi:MAG TPA: HIT family protein [Terriglobales bacterium]|jgi:diadenosine tetraphosphate (Ap4A) HIT family hydrolase|nr:HIT family protein [Terriglobales bacterium]
MARFEIHPQLLADCHRIGALSICHVLLHRKASIPWFILVPETAVSDLLDLPEALRDAVMAEAAALSRFVKDVLNWPKINFAAIGNVVPQMHLHVIGRQPGDVCWPAPVWGNLTADREYSAAEVCEMTRLLAEHCGLKPDANEVVT